MDQELFEKLKKEQISFVLKSFDENKSIYPHITIIGYHLEEDKPIVIHMPIPGKIMNNKEQKEFFVEYIIPDIKKSILEKNIEIKCVCFVSEMWKKEISLETNEEITSEGVIINMDCADFCTIRLYNIVRNNMKVTADGFESSTFLEFQDEKIDPSGIGEGLFANLYKKFTS